MLARVGHTDPKTTLRIYAHLLKRDRSGVGKALDEIIHGGVPSNTPLETLAGSLPRRALALVREWASLTEASFRGTGTVLATIGQWSGSSRSPRMRL